MKRVLFVAYYFPPVAASGAMRPLGFCRHLPSFGWDVSVVTTTPESVYPPHPVDLRLAGRIPPAVTIHQVPYQDPLLRLLAVRNKIRRLFRAQSSLRRLHDAPQEQASTNTPRPRSFLKDALLEWAWAFPDPQISWRSPALRRRYPAPDVVWATGGPWTNFLVGRALAKRFDRPLIIDYRDPWTCNPFYSFTATFLNRKARKLEQAVCMEASRVVTNTDELMERLSLEYPDIKSKAHMIPNGFDPEMIEPSMREISSRTTTQQGYELCHFGSVYGKRTPRVLLDAIRDLQREIGLTPNQLTLRFVGTWESTDGEDNKTAALLENQGFLRREPPVSHERCLQQMRSADILLVVQPDSPLQIPGKIYEYIAMGRPLLLIGGEGATANLMRRYHLGTSCPNNTEAVKLILKGMVEGRESIAVPDQEQVKRFDYHSLTGELVTLLESVAAKSGVQGTPDHEGLISR